MDLLTNKLAQIFVSVTLLSTVALAARPAHNPHFLRKLANPTQYKVSKNYSEFTESICGSNELQHVNEYDGSRGQPVEFVSKLEQGVAALAYGTPESSKKYCSGMLISENLFLTASHCIDGTTLNDFAVFNFQKTRGSEDLEAQEHVKILEVVEQTLGGLDFAILKLEGTPGEKYGFHPVNVDEVVVGHLLTIIQHPRGQPKQVDVGNRSGTRGSVYMTYNNLDTEPGSSGSAVLNETGLIVGVHTNGGCAPWGGDNAGVMMTEIVKHSPTIQKMTGWTPPAPAPTEPPVVDEPTPADPTPAPADPVAPTPADPVAPADPTPAPVDPVTPADPTTPADPGFIDPGLDI